MSAAYRFGFATRSWQELRYGHATCCGRSVSGTVRCGSAVAGGSVAFSGRGFVSGSGAAACIVSLAPFSPPPLRCARAPCAPRSLASSLTAPETLPDLAPNCALRLDPTNYVSSLPAHPAPVATLPPRPCRPVCVCGIRLIATLPCSGHHDNWRLVSVPADAPCRARLLKPPISVAFCLRSATLRSCRTLPAASYHDVLRCVRVQSTESRVPV